jgi:hypothetical protein
VIPSGSKRDVHEVNSGIPCRNGDETRSYHLGFLSPPAYTTRDLHGIEGRVGVIAATHIFLRS